MISLYSELDKVDDKNFGLRPIKEFNATSYFKAVSPHNRSNTFRTKLESAIGTMLPDYFKDKICSMVVDHCSANHISNNQSCEDIVISVMSCCVKKLALEMVIIPMKTLLLMTTTLVFSLIIQLMLKMKSLVMLTTILICLLKLMTVMVIVLLMKIMKHVLTMPCHVNDDHIALSKSPDRICSSPKILNDGCLVTPDVGYLKNCRPVFEKSYSASVAAAALKNVANKMKSRISQHNNDGRRGPLFPDSAPSFSMYHSGSSETSNKYSVRKENHDTQNVTPSSQAGISFRSLDDTPDHVISNNCNERTYRSHNSENVKKRVFHDITNSPDVEYLGQSTFPECCKKICVQTDELYNTKNNLTSNSRELSSTDGKVPPHGPRRVVAPSKNACDPFIVPVRRRFSVLDQEKNILSQSVGLRTTPNGIVMMLLILELLLTDLTCADLEKIQRSFFGAASARKLHLCDMLYFPILHLEHWFLFIVDIKDRMLVFLDSLNEKGDRYFEDIESLLVNNFQTVWDSYVGSPIDFSSFKIVYPSVPKQSYSCDSRIFVMKSIELWSPRIVLPNEFSKDDISNIRMQYANQIFFHPKNKMLQTEVEQVVLNWFDPVKFSREG